MSTAIPSSNATLLPWETAPQRYEELLKRKCAEVEARLSPFDPPAATIVASPREEYRARAEFRVWHEGDDLNYVMFDPRSPRVPVCISDFPQALAPIRELLAPLRDVLRDNQRLRRKLFQVEFMASTTGEVLLTLIYHSPLDDAWLQEAQELTSRFGVLVVGRSRKQKLVLSRDYIYERLEVNGKHFSYRQYEQAFTQPNPPVNAQMLAWACEQAASLEAVAGSDLLELYCGNGNFTLPLAQFFNAVIATELSKSGTRAAGENLRENAIDNVSVIRLSAEEVTEALAGVRIFRRLAALPRPLTDYQLDTVFVDPPRAGLDAATRECVQRFPNILYVSCNPDTLGRDLEQLHTTHRVANLTFFDQFPYTPHLESGVLLRRRTEIQDAG